MRLATVLLIGLGLAASVPFALAQPSASGPATAAPSAHCATEGPRSPAFEYLGTLSAETGTRTVIENGPAGDAHNGSIAKTAFETKTMFYDFHQVPYFKAFRNILPS